MFGVGVSGLDWLGWVGLVGFGFQFGVGFLGSFDGCFFHLKKNCIDLCDKGCGKDPLSRPVARHYDG